MFTIAGGTGLVGKQLTEVLLDKGVHVRVLTRDAAKAKAVFAGRKPEITVVDFDDAQSLAAGFAGTSEAFLSNGTSERQVRDELALIDAAKSVGVSYIVHLSVGGASRASANNVQQWHGEIDDYLAHSGVPHALIRPAMFIETVVGVAANFVPHGAWGGAAGNGRVALIDPRDVASVAAVLLTEGAKKHAGKIYDITGSEALTMPEIARAISSAIGKQVDYKSRILAEQRGVLASVGIPAILVDVLLGIDELTRANVFANPNAVVEALTGHRPRTVGAWIAEHLTAFSPKVA